MIRSGWPCWTSATALAANFSYRSEREFDPSWEERSYRLSDLDSLELYAVYWMGDAIAHTILSFGFGDERLAISIETRKTEGQTFSAIGGFFRQYHLVYVVGDERDLIALRTKYRQPQEDVYWTLFDSTFSYS